MQNLMNDLIRILSKDDRFFADGKILKNKLTETALKLDQNLLKLLLSFKGTRNYFFIEVKEKKGTLLVFDKDKFISFVNNKEFLPDSFTSFKKHIGLMVNGGYIRERGDTCLAWAYRDCVLEGGQEEEDQERDEIFFNEILAPDQIDKLFEPKVFTNFKQIDARGEHKPNSFSAQDNLIIKGNNLLALHSIKHRYGNKIKMIYLDPPYNKKNDTFYNDSFKDSTWLTFMKNRLEIAKMFLLDYGLIFIQIDDHQQAYLKVLCDEIFGRNSFVATVAVKMSEATGVKMTHAEKKLPKMKEYIHVYKKNPEAMISLKPIKVAKTKWDKEYKTFIEGVTTNKIERLKEIIADENRTKQHGFEADRICSKFKLVSLKEVFKKYGVAQSEELDWKYDNAWRIIRTVATTEVAKKLADEKKKNVKKVFTIVTPNKKMYIITPQYQENNPQPRIKLLFADDYLSINLGDFWQDIKTTGLENEGGVKLTKGKKPEELIRRLIEMSTKAGEIVLDFFVGSGTTAAVAHKMKRQYIGIEQLDYGKNDSVVRLKNVIKGDQQGISTIAAWKGGGSFMYMELKEWNQQYLTDIQKAGTTKTLWNVYNKIKKEAFFRYDVDLSGFNVKEFAKLPLKGQKQILFECLDKNHLYVNYSEMDDTTYKVSDGDKKLNRDFYKKSS
jgi:adenine-specific DNA-methyltransferase